VGTPMRLYQQVLAGKEDAEGSEETLPERKDTSLRGTYFYPYASKQHLVRKSSHSISVKYGASSLLMVPDQEDGDLHCYQTACWTVLSWLGLRLWGSAIYPPALAPVLISPHIVIIFRHMNDQNLVLR